MEQDSNSIAGQTPPRSPAGPLRGLIACLAGCGLALIRRTNGRLARIATHMARLAPHAGAARLRAQVQTIERRYQAALDRLPQGILLLAEDSSVVACNASLRALLGLPATALQPGDTLRIGLGAAAAQRHTGADDLGLPANWIALPDGSRLCVCEDIADRHQSERRIAHMTRHDPLTGLPNRLAARDALNTALARARGGERVWVHCVDLDRFKQINEALGQGVGDEVLREVARRLRAAVREDDTLAHLGSDEFVVIQFDSVQVDTAGTLARRLIEVLAHPIAVAGELVVIGASIGIAPVEPQERDPDALLRRANLALDRAKQEGRAGWRFFDRDMDTAARRRRELESDLREALHAEQFELFYQPLVSVRDRRVSGMEALVRWRHPIRGLIPPLQFIPLAEELGLIVPIGEWVLRTACAAAAQWPASVAVAVNLSSVQFLQPGLLEVVQAALAESGLPPERLELEITESVLLADSQATLDLLHRLRAMGIRISMDDFGTGYSSLSYLRSFPFDKLKIDKSFVSGLNQSEESEVIVRAIAALGHSLGMATTAEGVETQDQLERLEADGCTEVQGYFFSPPCPASDIPRLLVEIAVRGACAAGDTGQAAVA